MFLDTILQALFGDYISKEKLPARTSIAPPKSQWALHVNSLREIERIVEDEEEVGLFVFLFFVNAKDQVVSWEAIQQNSAEVERAINEDDEDSIFCIRYCELNFYPHLVCAVLKQPIRESL